MRIAHMTAEHVPQVAALEKVCFSDPWSEKSVASELENPLSCWLVALDGETVAGYVGSQTVLDETDMMNIAVHPDFRRQGEYLMVRLRTSDGADMHDLENRYHVSTAPYEQVFRILEKHGLAAHEGTRWYLTEQGFLVSNSIINAVVEAGE